MPKPSTIVHFGCTVEGMRMILDGLYKERAELHDKLDNWTEQQADGISRMFEQKLATCNQLIVAVRETINNAGT